MSLANIATLLGKSKAVKSTKSLNLFMEGLNKAQSSGGIQEAKSLFDKLTDMSPILSLGDMVVSKIQSSTVESTMGLFDQVLTLIQDESVGSVMGGVTLILNSIIDNATDVVLLLNTFSDLINLMSREQGSVMNFLKLVSDILIPFDEVVDLFQQLLDIFTSVIENAADEEGDTWWQRVTRDWWNRDEDQYGGTQ